MPKQEQIVTTGLLPDEPDYGHLAMKCFRWSELESLLSRHGEIVAAAAAGLLPNEQPRGARAARVPADGGARARERAGCAVVRGAHRRGPCGGRNEKSRLAIYLMAGPELPELAEAAVEAGADLVELGFPFSDPLADGPVIRRAAERALAQGMRTGACLEVLADTRARLRRLRSCR